MRFLSPPSLLLLGLLATASTSAADPSFVRVWHEYRTADSYQRIAEYFNGREATAGQVILRTQPQSRAGYYFLARTKNPGPARTDCRFVLEVLPPNATTANAYAFTAPLPAGQQVFQFGVTGSDWPAADTLPLAWRLRVLAPDGTQLLSQQSFLWDSPSPASGS